jgi:VWFA-related protein
MALARSLPLFIAGVVSITVTLQSQQPPADPRPQATFKTGIDIVQLDVSVLDKDRRPIRGLTIEDFTVLENGAPQPIVAVVPIEVADPPTWSAPWVRDAALDSVSNAGETRRLITIVMDDANTGFDLGESKSAKEIANAIVDRMGPDDLASVVFTYLGKPQNWTADRSQLRKSIDSFIPQTKSPLVTPRGGRGIAPAGAAPKLPFGSPSAEARLDGPPLACSFRRGKSCLVDSLWTISTAVETAPPGRKIIMLISSNGSLNVMENPDRISEIHDMFRTLQRANATVYAFDPRGLTTAPTGVETDDLRSIAAATGGRVFANTNAPEARVPDVFQQNGSYYLIGFRPTDTSRDGKFRRIQARVNRPGAEVRTRQGYYAAPPSRQAAASTRKPESALDAALTGLIASNDIPLTLSVAAFARPGDRDAALALVSSFTQVRSADGPTQRISLAAAVFDLEGRSHGTQRQTLEVKSGAETLTYDIYSRIPSLKPGRYEVRLAVESGGRAGSVFVGVDVPTFNKEDLALSGVLVERSSPLVANPEELASITKVKPTASRTFASSDRARAFLRVYQKDRQPVRASARIVNDRNESIFSRVDDLAGAAFGSNGSADYQVELPLASLTPGRYLLTVEAAAGDRRLTREVRFTVR